MTRPTTANENPAFTITLARFGVIAILFHIYGVWLLWNHRSVDPVFLGRFSYQYGAGFVAVVLSTLGFILMYSFFRQTFEQLIVRLPLAAVYGFLFLTATALIILFQSGFDGKFLSATGMSWMLWLLAVIVVYPDAPVRPNRWRTVIIVLVALLYIALFLTFLTWREYTPDEAWWADRANTFRLYGKLFARATFYRESPIEVGRGWFSSIYASLLDNVAFDIRIGRTIGQVMYLLGIAGTGAVAWRLYGKQTAFVTMITIFVSAAFFRIADYREDHFVPVGQTLAFFAVINARYAVRPSQRIIWDFLAGLLVTLSLQLHASALGFVVGLSIFYVGYFVISIIQNRRITMEALLVLFSFGTGALIGSALYYVFNMLPNGGLRMFIEMLSDERGNSQREFRYLAAPTLQEKVLIFSGFVYLLWRRNHADVLYLCLTFTSMAGIYIVDTQGYIQPYLALIWVPVGVPVVAGLRSNAASEGHNRRSVLALACILLAFTAQTSRLISWSTIRDTLETGQLPQHPAMLFSEIVVNRVPFDADETVIATIELLWAMPDHAEFYSTIAEGHAMTQRGWQGTEVWDYLEPDVYIEIVGRVLTPPGLQAYVEREQFVICDSFNAYGYDVDVKRRNCDIYED